MTFWREINDGQGFVLDSLTERELSTVRGLITHQYLGCLREVATDLAEAAAAAGIENYHTLQIPFDHGAFWHKDKRVLPAATVMQWERMGFFQRIRHALPSANIYAEDLMWRLVRPAQSSDVGPVHADKWFWDAGNGSIPSGYNRFKIWIGVCTEPGKNGLTVKPYSQTSTAWKHHFEFKHGKMKPVFDENAEELGMELLPLSAGQMVLFHDALLHGGALNVGTTCRVSIELTIAYKADEGERLSRAA